MAIRTINHPDVQINETDRSQYQPTIVGTNVLVLGFSDRGEEFNPLIPSSTQDYKDYWGVPTNEAERYAYYASKEVLDNGGTLIFGKLPYNNIVSKYYKGFGVKITTDAGFAIEGASNYSSKVALISAATSNDVLSGNGYYLSGAKLDHGSVFNLPVSAYDIVVAGGDWSTSTSWNLSGAGKYTFYDINCQFLIVNENKARLENDNQDGGIFVQFIDPIDAMKYQRVLPITGSVGAIVSGALSAESTSMDALSAVVRVIDGVTTIVDNDDFVMSLTDDISGESYSEWMMQKFPTIEHANTGFGVNTEYSNYVTVQVCRSIANPQAEGKLDIAILESFTGSIHKNKRDKATGQTVYICDLVNANSNYIKMYGRPDGTDTDPLAIVDDNAVLFNNSARVELMAFSKNDCVKIIKGQTMVSDINTILAKIANIDDIQIDVVEDAGLSTIAQFTSNYADGEYFVPDQDIDSDARPITSPTAVSYWRAVCDTLNSFCKDTRKDCMTILDVPRSLILQGNEKFIRKTAPTNTFSSTIGPRLRFLTGINSSYAAMYSDWFRMTDEFTGVNFWIPESVKVGGVYVYNDRVANIWDAPAGLNRGVVNGVNDISFNPGPKDADQLYLKSFNYAKQYPAEGYIVEGQKTTQVKPSAFDRVNVRRLFLRLERLVYQQARWFCYEPNNLFTRRRLVDTITPIFNDTKNGGGIYDYMIVCDSTNNTSTVIDNNELKVAILIKPVRTAEFLIVDFVATRTGGSFQEIIQELGIGG